MKTGMVITSVHQVDGDLSTFAWHRLKLFSNVSYTKKKLISLHGIQAKHHKNAENQAQQIRFCLLQAQEYFKSAEAATLATKPLLLYYALLSLVLAEIMLKGTGEQRLEKLREHQSAHGLSLSLHGPVDKDHPLEDVCRNLRATPQFRRSGEPYGTFEVWRKLVREYPVPVQETEFFPNGSNAKKTSVRFTGIDAPPTPSPKSGYSLLDAIATLPQLKQVLQQHNVEHECVRTFLSSTLNAGAINGKLELIVQPANQITLDKFYETMLFKPEAVNHINLKELPSGVIAEFPIGLNGIEGAPTLPPSIFHAPPNVHFVTNGWELGELGSFYVALHVTGNLVRYYPDLWMPHVESTSPLALLIQEVCDSAVNRLPVLTASEMDRTYYFQGTPST